MKKSIIFLVLAASLGSCTTWAIITITTGLTPQNVIQVVLGNTVWTSMHNNFSPVTLCRSTASPLCYRLLTQRFSVPHTKPSI